MPYTTLLTPNELTPHLHDPTWAIIDCRFSLNDTGRGRRAYLEAHIPGAIYAHLDDDLSGPIRPGETGRHPLPSVAAFAQTASAWGLDEGVQVVAYDDFGGGIAARLWWMLRWLGHGTVAVLDGGWPRWQAEGLPTTAGEEKRQTRAFHPHPHPELTADASEVDALRTDPSCRLLDARASARYRGEEEPLDPVAGHIPGAVSAPYAGNLTPEGLFLSRAQLRDRYTAILGGISPERTVCYCGSGVTAAHNLLALAHAGLDGARLYPGSWSHWITDPARPVAAGA